MQISVYLTFGNVRLYRRILLSMGTMRLFDHGQYAILYLDTDYNWRSAYHAMNNHFIRGVLSVARRFKFTS